MKLDELLIESAETPGLREELGWIALDGVRLFAVRHCGGALPRSRILVLSPIGAERERAHRTIVDTARSLARSGHEVLRFDPRGVGESEGAFESCTFGTWKADAEGVVRAMQVEADGPPIVLLGIRAGALIASSLFAEGFGDGLLVMAGADGTALLRDAARRALAAELVQSTAQGGMQHATPRSALAEVHAGRDAFVDGYRWTPALVSDASSRKFLLPDACERRPWSVLECAGVTGSPPRAAEGSDLNSHIRRVQASRFWESSPTLAPADGSLAASICEWIDEVLPRPSWSSARR